eukprot:TRINITY_DN29562_c0_g1_i1.p1 TRINITY_DN29562_c0_g1~~TRINITY_DN29562_c0_g1_i1.p1  ORF type:complete len:654 (+),score=111.77 TRINITY_DN29562_c0_g1_i1:136-2097(+)
MASMPAYGLGTVEVSTFLYPCRNYLCRSVLNSSCCSQLARASTSERSPAGSGLKGTGILFDPSSLVGAKVESGGVSVGKRRRRIKAGRSTSVCSSAAGLSHAEAGGDADEVTLLDYGAGNVRSVRNAIQLLGYKIRDVSTPEDVLKAKKLIFPGVGAFGAAMEVMNSGGLGDAIREYIAADKSFLGICLGMQLLFEGSTEFGSVEGLGVVPGIVDKFDTSLGLPVPHMGWNGLDLKQPDSILQGVNGRHVYFVHSYRAVPSPTNADWVLSTSSYGGDFISSIKRGNVEAVQFHPEKSGAVGLDILRRFLGATKSKAAEEVAEASKQSLNRKKLASSLAKRVIACLDVRSNDQGDLVVTKGDQYDVREQEEGAGSGDVRSLGKPVELARRYFQEGADEITFLNITGFRDFPLGDLPMLEVLRRASEKVFVPLTVGGGIRDFTDAQGRYYSSLEVAAEYFRSGADKISIGSEAVYAAEEYLKSGKKTGSTGIEQISYVYGNQAVVVSVDPRKVYVKDPSETPHKTVELSTPGPNGEKYAWYQCTVKGGREGRPLGAYELAKAVEDLGAGEILLNCIDRDGQGDGFDIDLVQLVSSAVSIPVIASSGAGCPDHFSDVFEKTHAAAALAAGIFHREEVSIRDVKEHLLTAGVETRLV